MRPLNIVFAGTPAFGLPSLRALKQSPHLLRAIYTQPDRPAGRGQKMQASAVKEWALAHKIPVHQPNNFKDLETIAELAALKPDVMVVIAYGLILPKAVLETPRLGCINVHASLLPRWRGAAPIQYAIRHNDAESGVTIMQMDVGMDTGAMLNKVVCPISATETASTLHDKLAQMSAQPLLDTLNQVANQTARPEIQNNELATYAPKINKEEARINWQQTAQDIDCTLRAFTPWPIAYTSLGKDQLRIHKARISPVESKLKPGTVIEIDRKGMLVATADQSILVEKIQLPGSKVISVADWLNSSKTHIQNGFCFDD